MDEQLTQQFQEFLRDHLRVRVYVETRDTDNGDRKVKVSLLLKGEEIDSDYDIG
jgi:hypothetical protein